MVPRWMSALRAAKVTHYALHSAEVRGSTGPSGTSPPLSLISVSEFNQRTGLNNVSVIPHLVNDSSVILLPLRPASQTHKNPKRLKIIHGMRPVGPEERSIDLKIFWSNILFT